MVGPQGGPRPFVMYVVFLFCVAFFFLMCFFCGAVINGWV